MSSLNHSAMTDNRAPETPPPADDTATLTPDELAEAHRYGRRELACELSARVADPAAVLQDRARRRPAACRAHGPTGRRDRPVDRRGLSHGPEPRVREGQRHADRPGTHAEGDPRRHAADELHRRRDRSDPRARD